MSIDRWMDKEDEVHMCNRMLLSHKENEIMPSAATWMQLGLMILSEGNSKREKQVSYYIINMRSLRYDTNEPVYKTETDS